MLHIINSAAEVVDETLVEIVLTASREYSIWTAHTHTHAYAQSTSISSVNSHTVSDVGNANTEAAQPERAFL